MKVKELLAVLAECDPEMSVGLITGQLYYYPDAIVIDADNEMILTDDADMLEHCGCDVVATLWREVRI